MSTISPNMGLVIPAVASEPGPAWASELNASLTTLDGHNHSPGQGVQIAPNGININTDLTFQSQNATNLRTTRFAPQLTTLVGATDIGCLYVVSNELYYNDVTGGHHIQITTNGSVNAGAGSITGLPTGTASASFSAGTFVWRSATSTAANMDAGSYVFRNSTASSFGLTLQPPAAMAGNFSLTLPSIPAQLSIMTIDTSGNMTGSIPVAGGIPGSAIASATITGSNIAASTVTGANIASQTIAQGNLALRPTGTTVAAGGIAVSASCGTFTTSSGTYVPVTNLSVTITTTGRPVQLMIVSDASANPSYISNNNTAGATGGWQFQRGASAIGSYAMMGAAGTTEVPSAALNCVDIVAAGTYTYTLNAKVITSITAVLVNAVLIAYEI